MQAATISAASFRFAVSPRLRCLFHFGEVVPEADRLRKLTRPTSATHTEGKLRFDHSSVGSNNREA